MSAVENVCHLLGEKVFSKIKTNAQLFTTILYLPFFVLIVFYLISNIIKLKSVKIVFKTIFEYKVERFGPCKNTCNTSSV